MGKEKIAPALRMMLADYRQKDLTGLKMHMRTMGIIAKKDSPKPPRVNVFIECDESGEFEDLRSEGIKVNQKKGGIRTAFLPVASLESFAENRDIHRILPSHYMKYSMDIAPGKVNLPPFLNRTGLSGKGVVIGIVDSGIDPAHAAFKGRIHRIWDQLLDGPGVTEADFGRELIGKQLIGSRDEVGHGTHVMGIAAGSDETYCGIAPKGKLVVVRTNMLDTGIANGVQYIFRIAGELNCPAVVNLSLGAHDDPHDGTDPLSRIIDQETGPGRIVCCAAGNEGDIHIHAHAKVSSKKKRTIRFSIPDETSSNGDTWVQLKGWYPGGDSISIGVITPDGVKSPSIGHQGEGEEPKTVELGECRVTVANTGPDPTNGDCSFIIEILNKNDALQAITPGTWSLTLTGDHVKKGVVDIWSVTSLDSDIEFSGTGVSDTIKIGSPGAAKSAITVGCYTTRNKWTNKAHETIDYGSDMTLDDVTYFSNEGPLRDGTKKPELVAPGAFIISALSSDSEVARKHYITPGFRTMCGTSMASPFVAGIVALLLERNPAAEPDDLKKIFRANCRVPGKRAGKHDTKWGYGLINAEKLSPDQ